MAQDFQDGPACRAGGFAIVGHTGLAAREQRPADVRGSRMCFAQTAQLDHGRVAVGDRNRETDKAALADIQLRADG
ncbi:hypothetical protein F4827_001868 [Paraburkholderia bannensis]|uniref:Uncharacterized protein n=1 Tax=Paraburkholderia bannensis TaxID=765414 RepID=A0A7W9TX77_9BURK|nr:hypothetical protein [Paraburkholderia sp. WP4_3_2]MBB6102020.1 hypothetical protein [Paraburkholderia bannensis]